MFSLIGLLTLMGGNPEIAGTIAERFTSLYKEFLPKIFKYITYKVTDTQTAEDLTSQVFEKALSKFKSHDAAKGAYSTWIFTIARNTVIDYYRASSKERELQQDKDGLLRQNDTVSPDDLIIRAEQFRTLKSLIAKLSPSEQEIISLKFGARMNNRQIAQATGLTESNVGTTIWRTVNKLRSNFREWENG